MADALHSNRYPGESEAYREARNQLLKAELELRERVESVAALRRKLPRGGAVEQDYSFDEIGGDGETRKTRLSELFQGGKGSLILYSFMYGPEASPCPMCTSFLDGLDRYALHIEQRVNLAVVAKSPIWRINDWAVTRDWKRLRLLSSANNSYNADYFAETPTGQQMPACNVFTKAEDGVFHSWAAEGLYVSLEGHPRHIDQLWPIWSFFDLTPEGRGDWMPKLSYEG